ncbi:MAG TPA: ParB/RepB/Spo0J family partition protein [Parcubacteria group bacterium]|jgi:ParB family chromosome partitioning protein|nr:ParB/RepB/Spo0J family partition protein [Parcubacteria group bacterium]
MSQFYNDSIFWIDVDKIVPNPFQPRREFSEPELQSLADSIRQYGVLQALVVTRKEIPREDGGLSTQYELIAGERRLRASKLAGLTQVPALIKVGGEENDLMKLELAIIENIQREDLNPVDRAKAFQRFIDEFGFTHAVIGKKVGKSREYVSNSIRLLALPEEILSAISQGKISEGHARPLMMLGDRPEEQNTLFKEIMYKKLTVREAEAIGRRIAYDKIKKKGVTLDPETQELEEKLTETLGTRVSIEKRENGGKILIDFFSPEDLHNILDLIKTNKVKSPTEMLDKHIQANPVPPTNPNIPAYIQDSTASEMTIEDLKTEENLDDRTPEEIKKDDNTEEEIYSIKNFSI